MATLTVPVSPSRRPEHQIHPLFFERWSRRLYTGEDIPDSVLFTLFEAARWAPSSSNAQPWRFLYSKRGSASWPTFFELLAEGNQKWAANASALVLLISQKTKIDRQGLLQASKSHSFDTGAAWQNLALQAHLIGWGTRAIGGFDRDQARRVLRVPDDFAVEAVVAIGKPARWDTLSSESREKEIPNSRHPLKELVFADGFPAA